MAVFCCRDIHKVKRRSCLNKDRLSMGRKRLRRKSSKWRPSQRGGSSDSQDS